MRKNQKGKSTLKSLKLSESPLNRFLKAPQQPSAVIPQHQNNRREAAKEKRC
jgi:hypothetical protein